MQDAILMGEVKIVKKIAGAIEGLRANARAA
jgi:hypothetical protein